jgi:hypothetical protein
MNRGALSDPSFIGLTKRPSMKKDAPPKMQKDLIKRPPMKKRQPKKRKGA